MPKWFTIATEGQTTDGRVIERTWLEQIVETYNRKTYGARVSIEHQKSVYPDSMFRAYGDVTAVQTVEENGKLKLQAQIDPTPELVALTKSRQKIYSSIEVNPNFAKSGKAYLTGLAVTDTPASLGTDVLEFCAQHPDTNPLAHRKTAKECLFSSALETDFDFADPADDKTPKMFQRLRSMLGRGQASDSEHFRQVDEALSDLAEHVTEKLSAAEKLIKDQNKHFATVTAGFVTQEKFDELKAQLDKTPRSFSVLKPATGTDDNLRADC